MNQANDLIWEEIKNSGLTRIKLATESQYWFAHLYFGENVTYQTADFQREIYDLTSNPDIQHVVMCAFRGSGKSTIATLICPIWSILGKPQKKFVLILSQTQPLAKAHLMNIKRAFETNELLRKDFGPLEEESDEWGSMSLVLTKYNARISAASVDQSIRGIRHGAYRPDLIIADDVEDVASTKTRENRDRTFEWFVSEVIPLGDKNTKIINIGNLLHEDSLIMRLKEKIDKGELEAEYREYPIINEEGAPLWTGKYPDQISIEQQHQKIADERSWLREFMLRIVPDNYQIINPEWIQYYDELPDIGRGYIGTFIGVDLAISEKTSADYTAIVVIHVFGYPDSERRYYVDRLFVNKHLTFGKTVEEVKYLYFSFRANGFKPIVLVEDVGYQSALVESLIAENVDAVGIKIRGDKSSRLAACSKSFEQEKVFFPDTEDAQLLIQQIIGFGVEKHDDLVDATTLAINHIHTYCCRMGLLLVCKEKAEKLKQC